ncbi:MAG: ArsR family transcriptional regulator, zinc-responsive transcriptional repressor [Frankiales bacterium]|jgi:DNA-binding transcriptional ArsR family regulator|nr:ArsR family transcriptional regulator, zinc-responsive transcriptional repressor [Frankiales bacterium]
MGPLMADEHDASGPPLAPVNVAAYEPASEVLRALTASIRLALVDILSAGPRCVHELVDALGVPQPLVSQHLKVLRAADLVATSRRGREIVYRLVDEHVSHVVRDTVAHAAESPAAAQER